MVSVTRKMWPGKDPDFNIKQYHNKIINMYTVESLLFMGVNVHVWPKFS